MRLNVATLGVVSESELQPMKSGVKLRGRARRSRFNTLLGVFGLVAVVIATALLVSALTDVARWNGTTALLWFGAIVMIYLAVSGVTTRHSRR